jgi:hypothetical protein
MSHIKYLFGLFCLIVMLTACENNGTSAPEATNPAHLSPDMPSNTRVSPPHVTAPETTPPSSVSTNTLSSSPTPLTKAVIDSCPVTLPNVGTSSPSEHFVSPYGYGNGALWVTIGIGGKIVPAPEQWNEDGSLNWKTGWYRGSPGELTVTGRRLDAPGPPVQGHYGEGYGDLGFQAGFIYFPSAGCWEITGKAGDTSLTYVTLVVQLPFEPVEPTWLPEGLHRKDYDFTDYPTAVQTVWAFPTLEVDQVVWSNSEVRIETTQNLQEGQSSYPDAAQQPVIVNGQPGICV